MAASARLIHTQQVHFLRKGFTFGAAGVVDVGCIPANSVIIKPMSGVFVSTAFNGTAPQTVGIGTTANTALFGSALALSAQTFVATAQSADFQVYGDTNIQAIISASAATAGNAIIIVCYVPNTDL
jgi:hypothetical protein